MIAKVNDKHLTGDDAQAMTPAEFKAFENRLRSKAKGQGLKVCKINHPLEPYYLATLDTAVIEVDRLDVIGLKNYLYSE